MSHIPDCRTDEYYNGKYLAKEDSNFIRGFDWCVEMAVDNFFDNHMDGLEGDELYLGHILCEELPENMSEEYEIEYTFDDRKTEKRKIKTYADLIRYKILHWIEMERDMVITSMIDAMDEDKYEAIKKEVDGKEQ